MMMTAFSIIVGLVAVGLLVLLLKEKKNFTAFKNEYKGIVDVDDEIRKRTEKVTDLDRKISGLSDEFDKKLSELTKGYKSKREIYEALLREISILEEDLENISYGLYKPHYNYNTSEEFKQTLEQIRAKQKELIKAERATYCPVEWEVGGSKREGAKMTKQYSKLMLRAFNGECDAAIARVSWNNIANMEARIDKAFEAINKLGSTQQITVTNEYSKLKLQELRLEYELEEKLFQEKEEQRRIKEQMREEEIAQREIEKAQKEAEEEEKRYQKALEKAKADMQNVTGQKLDELNKKIQELEINLQQAKEQKERAVSRAQLTKSGHVYIISNIGSFGEDVYKIGMTRRLEPIDRVKELGDASVPFEFDVHGIIYSENAPELEYTLHRRFDDRRINLVNSRREFFRVTLEDIEIVVQDMNLEIQLTKVAEAKEFRESLSIREAKSIQAAQAASPKELEKFPTSI